ncbi:MAG: GatB/YqeY domain-containing protein [Candidatus Beckwithbacteria bacterium]
MKQRDTSRMLVLRCLMAALKNKEIEKQENLNEEEEIKIINKEAKKRQDAIIIYKQANRLELAEKEEIELGIIKSYL